MLLLLLLSVEHQRPHRNVLAPRRLQLAGAAVHHIAGAVHQITATAAQRHCLTAAHAHDARPAAAVHDRLGNVIHAVGQAALHRTVRLPVGRIVLAEFGSGVQLVQMAGAGLADVRRMLLLLVMAVMVMLVRRLGRAAAKGAGALPAHRRPDAAEERVVALVGKHMVRMVLMVLLKIHNGII